MFVTAYGTNAPRHPGCDGEVDNEVEKVRHRAYTLADDRRGARRRRRW
ncbi:hypothetical protein [Streptomyces sp. NPDC001714]